MPMNSQIMEFPCLFALQFTKFSLVPSYEYGKFLCFLQNKISKVIAREKSNVNKPEQWQ